MATPTTTPPPAASSLLGLDALFSNPVFAGGIGLAGLGAAAAFGRRAVISGARVLRQQMIVNYEISKRDPSYPWLLHWLSQPRDNVGFLVSRLTRVRNRTVENFGVHTGYGRHIIKHRSGAYVAVNREKTSAVSLQTGEPHETLTLSALYVQRNTIQEILAEARALSLEISEGYTVVYTGRRMEWERLGKPRKKRPLASVILGEGIKERIVGDVKEFVESQQWYVDRGVPYRRGYLLYGPPGTGKTSFIQALAGEMNYSVAMINLSEVGMTDDRLALLLTKLPERSILVLEDVDAAFVNRRQRDGDGYNGPTVTFSGLLNALDGLAAGEDRIAFLTTNHIELLDPALVRPGRVDMMVRIGEATRYQAGEMWTRFYGEIDPAGSYREKFLKRLDELGLFEAEEKGGEPKRYTSTAAIQGLFQFNKDSMKGAIEMAEGLVPRALEDEQPSPETITTPS
ncbi:hypothetical protein GQ53DRAFT_751370 [Thozetella sp. PMI_491]|nr:hypothetical protein GQ53DRAFT_751370 [Thozetella sp. PMI_491]